MYSPKTQCFMWFCSCKYPICPTTRSQETCIMTQYLKWWL